MDTNLSPLPSLAAGPGLPARVVKQAVVFVRTVLRLIGTLFVIGFSLLPLAALLVALPAVSPNEAVLTDTVRPARSWLVRSMRRVLAFGAGLVVLVALFAFAIEFTSRLPLPPGGQLGTLAKKVLGSAVVDLPFFPDDPEPPTLPAGTTWLTPKELLERQRTLRQSVAKPNADPLLRTEAEKELAKVEAELAERTPNVAKLRIMQDPVLAPILAKPLWTLLPPTLVQHWPFVFLIVYATDLGLLLLIGKVPLSYNLRYLWVRRRDTLLTAVVFTVVVALVVVLLAFVNGMYQLNESTGVPGNVLVLSEGSTDEIFSNLGRSDANDIERVTVDRDAAGRPFPKPVGVQRVSTGSDGKPLVGSDGKLIPLPANAPAEVRDKAAYLASRESFMVMNQPVPAKPGAAARRRLLQVRALENPHVAGAVHNIGLYPGGKWFPPNSVETVGGKTYLACCVGEGSAGTLGEDVGKRRLEPGDTFNLGDEDWIVSGVMNTQGTTYGSEIWTGVNNTVVTGAGRGNKYTTMVLRMEENTDAASRAMASFLSDNYTQVKLKAYSEPDYYKELTKTNESFLVCIVIVAVVMAIGGVFGVMNTMFASIAARIKEVGVMRILGFKRWQILIAFMLESLTIAFVGGLLGCILGSFANGFEATSNLSGGQGGGKSVALKMIVDFQILAAGMLFTLVLGRLGGLVPALSAMRMEILESLR
ncbi:ABC transporter permease [Gemmata sp.]|uniref:ABC transporter permease n=1 Tax=Gemmata sp. TaxID=1914242 RepID=UPI003F710436